jgi:membrane-associated phospholipid phosphatase
MKWSLVIVFVLSSGPALAQTRDEANPGPPSLVSVFSELGRDVRHVASRDSAVILGAAGAASLAVSHADEAITRRAVQSLPLETVLDQGALMGDGIVQVGAAVGVYGVGRALHHTRTALVGADLLQAQLVNGLLTQSLKYAVNRTRPDGGHYSFPSGHASATFATATVLERQFGWRVGVPALALASYVAASRLSENKHFPSDVIFGAGIGIVSGRSMTIRRRTTALTVTPMSLPGGGGVWIRLAPSGS